MMLLSAIAAVLLAVVAKRRIGAARPNTPQEAHPEAHEAPPAAGTKRTMATIIADYDLDAENASETIDAAEVDEVFGGHLPPDVKQVINSLGGRNLRILPQCEDGTYLSGIYERGDDNYATAMQYAIEDDNAVVVKCILANGGKLEVCNECGQTPLLMACDQGKPKISEFLLARGADISAKATNNGGPTCLHTAAYYNYPDLADVLLAHGAPLDEPMDDGASPLYIACMQDHLEVAMKILAAGADPNIARDDGVSPLFIACEKGQSEVVQKLLNAGADPYAARDGGFTPLTIACQNGHSEAVRVLLDAGADVTSQDGNYMSCLHFAAFHNHPSLVDVLLAHDAPVDQLMAKGASPLFIACEKGHTEVARKLLDAGADPHMARDDGVTVFTMTFERKCDIKALMNNAS